MKDDAQRPEPGRPPHFAAGRRATNRTSKMMPRPSRITRVSVAVGGGNRVSMKAAANTKILNPSASVRRSTFLTSMQQRRMTRTAGPLAPPNLEMSESGGTLIDQTAMRRASLEVLDKSFVTSRASIVDFTAVHKPSKRSTMRQTATKMFMGKKVSNYGSIEAGVPEGKALISSNTEEEDGERIMVENRPPSLLATLIEQTSAVTVVALLNIMVAIPFGASYFPISWKASSGASDGSDIDDMDMDEESGVFPLPGKQALGIRMFLFAAVTGQLVLTFTSRFINPVGLQIVETVPFLHTICNTVIRHQGYGIEALSTVFFLYACCSLVVGATFYTLGKMNMGKIVYFFPTHVLIGCIGGIGVYLIKTALEVSTDNSFTFDLDGLQMLADNINLLGVVIGFECVLRFLQFLTKDENGAPKYTFLLPVYYCLITPIFYFALWSAGISNETAMEMGYFFPPVESASTGGVWGVLSDPHLWDIFKIIDIRNVSFPAFAESLGTMIALAAFSLILVPIYIPTFAASTDVDADMNVELMAHGYANVLSGICGGLPTYMTYSTSVLYAKSGGKGKISSLGIVAGTLLLFVIGPSIASFLPRCMAGTLLLHIGIDLALQGVYDSYGDFDSLEYAGIWAIAITMTLFGMTQALIVGVIAALTTYAVQSINNHNPVRQILTASTLRSSAWNRCSDSMKILNDDVKGRPRILIFQLQGHLFFGNVAQLTDTIKDVLTEKHEANEPPIVVILDFTLVVGMDSSAAHAVAKLKKVLHRVFNVEVSMFVFGADRETFPCEFDLEEALSPAGEESDCIVSDTLDDALCFAEDVLIAREDPSLKSSVDFNEWEDYATMNMSEEEERDFGKNALIELLPNIDGIHETVEMMWASMKREVYQEGEAIWEFNSEGDSMKLLVCGELVAVVEETGAAEIVPRGNLVGELGLVHGSRRLTLLLSNSEEAVLYSLSRAEFERLRNERPDVATAVDAVAIRYLTNRVQHVSNRYFSSTLPI